MAEKEAKNKDKKEIVSTEKSARALDEERILKFWQDNKVFERSEQKGGEDFFFYDGPPFATGLPHYGHILAGTIKDSIPRYQTMQGKRVRRRWGWDCHGLPLENQIEAELGIKTKKDIETVGVDVFNEAARKAVLRYADDWKKIVPRAGRWVDMENDYRTMDTTYSESVWWAFKNLHDRDLIYKGFKGMMLCPRCGTTLSNFEVAQGYKDITDLAVTLKFELTDEPGTFLLAWTTTPWTLPGNTAVGVNPKHTYVKAQRAGEQDGAKYIVGKDKLSILGEGAVVIEEYKGTALAGKSYQPLFDYYKKIDLPNKENIWKVYALPYVEAATGTGLVHLAPAYGAEDLEYTQPLKVPIIHHVGTDGLFKKEVTDFAGMPAKPKDNDQDDTQEGLGHMITDVAIIKNLARRGLLFAKEKIVHSYPHCWRCETPLLNYAATSWFVKVSAIKDQLIAENKKITWVPSEMQEGRFGKILEGAPDWAISRSRYWGAPLPVWACAQCETHEVFGSIKELTDRAKTQGNTFIALRHGEGEHNVKGVCSSNVRDGYHLTDTGKKEVKAFVQSLKGKKISAIYAAPATRTQETAALVAEAIDFPVKQIVTDTRLHEFNFGDFDGKPYQDFLKYEAEHMPTYDTPIPNGESYLGAKKRFGEFLYDVNQKHEAETILIVSHGIALETLKAVSEGADMKRSKEIIDTLDPQPGSAIEFVFKELPHNTNYELDLHRPYIDTVVIPCDCAEGAVYTRIPDVFDCWFESGSMAYGQWHYPFENLDRFNPEKHIGYPANFIAEGLDQTRGWFYSLLVLGVALFGRAPYQHVIVNGLILAEDGRKMSKKLKNYPEVNLIFDKYGADALRYYLLSSPIARGEDLNFSERGVDEVLKKIILRLDNVYALYALYRDAALEKSPVQTVNKLDLWILARLNQLIAEATLGMDAYELDRATRPINLFIDDLSTWYTRRSRERMKSEDPEERNQALSTLYLVMLELSKVMAPSMPFYTESLFQKLIGEHAGEARSVHLEEWPKANLIDTKILAEMKAVREVVSLALLKRTEAGLKVRQPLLSLTAAIHPDLDLSAYTDIIKEEVNVKDVVFTVMKDGVTVTLDTQVTPE